MELYLVRHGETESNRERRYQGWSESPLSAEGLRQAEKVSFFLAGQGISAVYCSDLKRALHTARVVGAGCGLKPVVNPLLREVHFGSWEGLTFDEIEAQSGLEVSLWIDDPFSRSAPGGETLVEVCARMQSFLRQLDKAVPQGERVVAVSHGGAIRALLYLVLNLRPGDFWDIKIGNASVSLLQREKDRYRVAYYNRVVHLERGNREPSFKAD